MKLAGVLNSGGEGHATGDADALIEEEFFERFDGLFGHRAAAAVGFDIDLVDFDLAGDIGPVAFEGLQVQRALGGSRERQRTEKLL